MDYVKKGFQQPEITTNDNIKKATDRNKRDALPQSIDWRANGVVLIILLPIVLIQLLFKL